MNPTSNESNGMNLPAPVQEQPASFPVPVEAQTAAPEQAVARPEASLQPAAPAASLPVLPLPTAGQQFSSTAANDVTKTSKTVVPSVLEDSDLIEKEWVNKAKAIVEKNRDDPYRQSEELTVVRAEYLQQNYNKTIKPGK